MSLLARRRLFLPFIAAMALALAPAAAVAKPIAHPGSTIVDPSTTHASGGHPGLGTADAATAPTEPTAAADSAGGGGGDDTTLPIVLSAVALAVALGGAGYAVRGQRDGRRLQQS